MADSKLRTNHSDIESIISVAAIGTVAESIATAGGSIPAGAGELHCQAAADLHWSPPGGGTPTSTFGHKVLANELFILNPSQQASLIISDSGSDQILLVAFKKGSVRQDAGWTGT